MVCSKRENLNFDCFSRCGIVLVFSIINPAVEDFREPARPAFIGADRLPTVIHVDDLKLREGGKTLTPAIFSWCEPKPSLVPAIPQQDLHAVIRLQQMCQIKGQHLRCLCI